MACATIQRRLMLLLTPLPSVLVFSCCLQQVHARQVASRLNEELYARLTLGLSEYEVKKLFGKPGTAFAEPGWPSTLGWMPGYKEAGSELKSLDGEVILTVIVPPHTPVSWKRWPALDGDGWIVVAFIQWARESTILGKAKCSSIRGGYRAAQARSE
jgi:hypothetical protein